MDGEECFYLNEAIKKCHTLSTNLQLCLFHIQTLNWKYPIQHQSNRNRTLKKFEIILVASVATNVAPLATVTADGNDLNDDDDDADNDDDDADDKNIISSRSDSITSINSQQNPDDIRLLRTIKHVIQCNNNLTIRAIKIRRIVEEISTKVEQLLKKYGENYLSRYSKKPSSTSQTIKANPATLPMLAVLKPSTTLRFSHQCQFCRPNFVKSQKRNTKKYVEAKPKIG